MWKYFAAWCLLLLVAVANGILRDLSYGQYLSESLSQQLSTLSAMLLMAIVIWAFIYRYPIATATKALAIGLLWMLLTIAFEFLFFHFVAGHPWNDLLDNYKIWQGRLWPILLLWIALAPYTFFRLGKSE